MIQIIVNALVEKDKTGAVVEVLYLAAITRRQKLDLVS